jgi:hypothetical protein
MIMNRAAMRRDFHLAPNKQAPRIKPYTMLVVAMFQMNSDAKYLFSPGFPIRCPIEIPLKKPTTPPKKAPTSAPKHPHKGLGMGISKRPIADSPPSGSLD